MKNSSPTGLKEDFERMILEAEIMLRGTDPEQREGGRQKLREIMSLAEGSIYAQRALEILATVKPRLPKSIDPELDELIELWPSIQGFNDYRLADFLRQLESCQGTAVPLRTEVIRQLRKWIVDELQTVGTGVSLTKTEALNDFVAAVRGVAAFEELPEFGQLRDRLFQKRLQETAARIDAALAAWAPEEAQRFLGELNPFPDVFKVNVERLQADIDEVDSLRRMVDRLFQQLPDRAPNNWFEARLQAELQQQLEQHRTNNRVPPDWRSRLDETLVVLADYTSQFVRGQAQGALTIPLLRDFWTEFERLTAASHAEVSGHWFTEVAEALAAAARRDVERAANVDELMAVANSLRADTEGVPPSIVSRLSAMADTISHTATIWKAMQEGQSFALPDNVPDAFPIPKALRDESHRYSAWLEEIEKALNSFIDETPIQSERVYYDGLQLAETILMMAPHHALALKLQQESKRRLACYQMDQALSGWNLESFFKLFETDSPGEIYGVLLAYKDVLVKLRNLARQAPLKNWRDAGEWWGRWQAAANRLLPVARPDALTMALDQQAAKRELERYATLDRLLQDDLIPDEYESAASSLDHETDPSLKSYQQELLRKAAVGRIEEQIRSGRLEEAAKKLGSLPPTSTDAIRLRTRLEVEQSRQQSSVAAAEYLFQEWENVRTYVEQPEHLLLETITAVWVEGEQDSVLKMLRLISRLLREATENEITQRLTDWQTWVEIEEGLFNNFSSGAVKQLADYLRNAERGELLDQRLKRVVRHWQSKGDIVMLAWAYQAFQGVSTAARQFDEAANDLVRESDRVASEIETVLAGTATLDFDELQPLLASLQHEEERWRSLEDFLSLLWHPVECGQPSLKFAQTRMRVVEVSRLLALLARLNDADLRQDIPRQDFEDADSRARRLKNIAGQKQLMERLDRLRPLTEDLFFLQERMRETAERCRSKDALDVLEPGLFHMLATYVRNVVDIFVKAEAKDGKMWTLVSAEYESKIYRDACVLLPVSGFCQLDELVNVLEELHAEELSFTEALRLLEDRDRQPTVAWGGAFDPKPHLDYLHLIPQQAPRSLKVYHRFERARRDTLKIILEAPESRPHLPVWVHNYLDNGVPLCASGL